jgi:hypothetical protein
MLVEALYRKRPEMGRKKSLRRVQPDEQLTPGKKSVFTVLLELDLKYLNIVLTTTVDQHADYE